MRSIASSRAAGPGWRDYLATGGRLHYDWWSWQFFAGSQTALFPGITAMTLAGVALISGVAFVDPRARIAVAIGLVGFALSFGPTLPGYAFLHETVPLLSGLRNAARWGWLGLVALAMLAGFGVARLEYAWSLTPRRRAWPAVAVVVCTLATVEAIRTPVGFTPFTGIPRIYNQLAADGVVRGAGRVAPSPGHARHRPPA